MNKTGAYVNDADTLEMRQTGFVKAMNMGAPFQTTINDLQTYVILLEEISAGFIQQIPTTPTEREWYVIWNEVH